MKKSRLEKVLEYMVNGENDLATEMLHEHLIETARNIYADLAERDARFESDLDEALYDDDESGDFGDDIDSIGDEIDTENYFGEDDDLEDASDDLDGEMDDDMGDEFGGDDMDDMDDMGDEFGGDDMEGDLEGGMGNADIDSAMVNVEDAMAELKAAFADIMGDEGDDGLDDEVSDEFDDMELDDEGGDDEFDDEDDDEAFSDAKIGEATTLVKKAPVTMKGDEDGKASPLKQNQPNISDRGKAVKFAGGADEKGGKAASVKTLNMGKPQDNKGRMDKKVPTPPNKSEKAKSNLGS